MPDEQLDPAASNGGFQLTHEIKFYIAILVGLIPSPFLWNLATVHEAANEIVVRPPMFLGVIYVLLACYAAYEYFKHHRTEEPVVIPFLERYLVLAIIALAVAATHYCGAVVSVSEQKFVAYEPLMALLGNTSHEFTDLQQIELGQDEKGKAVLLISRKGKGKRESIRCDALIKQVLPKLSAAAKAKGVDIVGF